MKNKLFNLYFLLMVTVIMPADANRGNEQNLTLYFQMNVKNN